MAVFQELTNGVARFGRRVSRNFRTMWDAGPVEFMLRVLGAGGATSWVASFTLPMLAIPFVNVAVVGLGILAAGAAVWHYMGQLRKAHRNDMDTLKIKAINAGKYLETPKGSNPQEGITQTADEHVKAMNSNSPLTEKQFSLMTEVAVDTKQRAFQDANASLRENLVKYREASNELSASSKNRVVAVKKLFALSNALENAEGIPAHMKLSILQHELVNVIKDVKQDVQQTYFKRPSTLLYYLNAAKVNVVEPAEVATAETAAYKETTETVYKQSGLIR